MHFIEIVVGIHSVFVEFLIHICDSGPSSVHFICCSREEVARVAFISSVGSCSMKGIGSLKKS